MIDPQIAGLAGAAFNTWRPYLVWLAGVVVALALARLAMAWMLMALGDSRPRRQASGYQPLLFGWLVGDKDAEEAEPAPAVEAQPAGPWYREIWVGMIAQWRHIALFTLRYVRGDRLNPWWRVSWRGLDKAFSRANWALFFACFLGAFVCAAMAAAGAPLGPIAAVYAILGAVWIMVMITVVLCLVFGEVAAVVLGLFSEFGAFFGYLVGGALVLLIGFIAAALRRRAISYVVTLWKADGPLWRTRIIPQAEAVDLFVGDTAARERRRQEREARRAGRPKRSRARNLAEFALTAGMYGLVLGSMVLIPVAAGVGLGTAAKIVALALVALLRLAIVIGVVVAPIGGLLYLELKAHRRDVQAEPEADAPA